MAHDAATYEAQLTLIQTAITAALTNPRPDYKVGEVTYNHASFLEMLFDQQEKIIKILTQEIPQEQITTLQSEIDGFGNDLTQYANEPEV